MARKTEIKHTTAFGRELYKARKQLKATKAKYKGFWVMGRAEFVNLLNMHITRRKVSPQAYAAWEVGTNMPKPYILADVKQAVAKVLQGYKKD